MLVSLLTSVTVIPFFGAGVGSVTGNAIDWPGATERFAGITMLCAAVTVTLSVALATFAAAAVMVVAPAVIPVTVKVADFEPPVMVTVEGIETMPAGAALRFTTRPAEGAEPDSVTVRVCVPVALILTFCGANVSDAVMVTVVDEDT